MAKQPGINLNNRSLGMSSDEYSGGSFLYGQNINISRNSKSFRISDNIINTEMSSRSGNIIAIVGPYYNNYAFAFGDDGYIESNNTYNSLNLSRDIGGPLYVRSSGYNNAIKLGGYTYATTSDKIDVITGDLYTGVFAESRNIIVNPNVSSDTGWTVGSGWTTGTSGATHTSGTASLSQSITVDWTKKQRISINVIGNTLGTCQIKLNNSTIAGTITSSSPKRNTFIIDNSGGTWTSLDIVPSTTFNGTIQYVSIGYLTGIELDKLTITSSTTHPILEDGGLLYIGSGNKVDIVDIGTLSTPTLSETIGVVDRTHTIFAIHKIGQSIVLFSTNQEDTKISYWDGISLEPSEVILRKDKVGTNAVVDGNLAYVLCESGYKKELYVMSGYDKKLIALGKRSDYAFGYNKDSFRLEQRNDFYNNPLRTNAMGFSGNKLLIPSYNGVYTYGFENPNGINALVKEWSLDTNTISASANVGGLTYIAYKNYAGTKNYMSYVRTYENQYSSNNYMVSNPILQDNFSSKKQLDRFRLGYILPSSSTSIDIYVSANKNYFRTFTVAGVSVTPTEGSIYYTEYGTPYNLYEVISTNIVAGAGTISCRTTNMVGPYSSTGTLTKLSGTGDSTISWSDSDNFIHLKTITATTYTQGEDLIFGQEFLSAYMPDWHTIQLKIKLNSSQSYNNPEVFDIPILAEIVGQNG